MRILTLNPNSLLAVLLFVVTVFLYSAMSVSAKVALGSSGVSIDSVLENGVSKPLTVLGKSLSYRLAVLKNSDVPEDISKLDVPQKDYSFNPKVWDKPVNIDGRKVYKRDDLFDANHISSWKVKGKTFTGKNIERMASGRAPIGHDGNSIELHHLTQNEVSGLTGKKGALAEVSSVLLSNETTQPLRGDSGNGGFTSMKLDVAL